MSNSISVSKSINVFSTNGGTKTINTNATTWGELQSDLSKNNITFNGMKAVDNGKRTFENKDAVLPQDLTTLFLFPVKTKSGSTNYTPTQAAALSFSECRNAIKEYLAEDEAATKAHFNEGKNYTTKSTDVLRELVGTYKPKSGKASTSTAAPAATKSVAKAKAAPAIKGTVRVSASAKGETKANVADVVKSVEVSKTQHTGEVNPEVIAGMLESLTGYVTSEIQNAIRVVKALKPIPAAREKTKEELLQEEAREIAKGFNDIKY